MDENERQEKIEAIRQRIQRNNEAWIAWSQRAAESSVNELLLGKVIRPDQADFARKIIAQDLHVMLLGGAIPPS